MGLFLCENNVLKFSSSNNLLQNGFLTAIDCCKITQSSHPVPHTCALNNLLLTYRIQDVDPHS